MYCLYSLAEAASLPQQYFFLTQYNIKLYVYIVYIITTTPSFFPTVKLFNPKIGCLLALNIYSPSPQHNTTALKN